MKNHRNTSYSWWHNEIGFPCWECCTFKRTWLCWGSLCYQLAIDHATNVFCLCRTLLEGQRRRGSTSHARRHLQGVSDDVNSLKAGLVKALTQDSRHAWEYPSQQLKGDEAIDDESPEHKGRALLKKDKKDKKGDTSKVTSPALSFTEAPSPAPSLHSETDVAKLPAHDPAHHLDADPTVTTQDIPKSAISLPPLPAEAPSPSPALSPSLAIAEPFAHESVLFPAESTGPSEAPSPIVAEAPVPANQYGKLFSDSILPRVRRWHIIGSHQMQSKLKLCKSERLVLQKFLLEMFEESSEDDEHSRSKNDPMIFRALKVLKMADSLENDRRHLSWAPMSVCLTCKSLLEHDDDHAPVKFHCNLFGQYHQANFFRSRMLRDYIILQGHEYNPASLGKDLSFLRVCDGTALCPCKIAKNISIPFLTRNSKAQIHAMPWHLRSYDILQCPKHGVSYQTTTLNSCRVCSMSNQGQSEIGTQRL